jgi:hypothetical protein
MDVNKETSEYLSELSKNRTDVNQQEAEVRSLMMRYNKKIERVNRRYIRKIQQIKLKYY